MGSALMLARRIPYSTMRVKTIIAKKIISAHIIVCLVFYSFEGFAIKYHGDLLCSITFLALFVIQTTYYHVIRVTDVQIWFS